MLWVFAACLVVVATAQEPYKCEAPKVFEAKAATRDWDKKWGSFGRISYDSENERSRFVEELFENKEQEYYDTINLHKEEKRYVINMKTKTCKVEDLKEAFIPIEVPKNSTYRGSWYIGTSYPGYGVEVSEWSGYGHTGARVWSRWTTSGCVPVHFGYDSKDTGVIISDFFDVTFGISDPDVFTVPLECYKNNRPARRFIRV